MEIEKINMFAYKTIRFLAQVMSFYCCHPVILRNELKHKKGPCVILANHESSLDFSNVVPRVKGPVHSVLNRSIYNAIPPLPKPFEKLKRTILTPVLQFQYTLPQFRSMKAVLNSGHMLLLYPSGNRAEDGIASPITSGTWDLLKWLDADIYAARHTGTYFVLPIWASNMRRGKTTLDIYKLIDRKKLSRMTTEEIGKTVTDALYYDAYRDQEKLKLKYRGCEDIRGLENVLYMCPNCLKEFTIHTKGKSTLHCSACGYAETSDEYGFLHKTGDIGEEIRYVSDWSRRIREKNKEKLLSGTEKEWAVHVTVQMFDPSTRSYPNVGQGTLSVSDAGISLSGEINGQETNIKSPPNVFPTMPIKPGEYIEVRNKDVSYRCIPDNVMMIEKLVHRIQFNYFRSREGIHAEAPAQ